jgi:predicted transcriptional regulator
MKKKINGYRRLRLKTGLSIKKMAELIGVNQRTVYAWEHEEQEPQAKMFLKLFNGFKAAGLINLTFDDMLDQLAK